MGLDAITTMLVRWVVLAGWCTFLSWQLFKRYKCLPACLVGLGLHLGRVTKDKLPVWKSLRMKRK